MISATWQIPGQPELLEIRSQNQGPGRWLSGEKHLLHKPEDPSSIPMSHRKPDWVAATNLGIQRNGVGDNGISWRRTVRLAWHRTQNGRHRRGPAPTRWKQRTNSSKRCLISPTCTPQHMCACMRAHVHRSQHMHTKI